jgi:hypothetical protein
MAKTDWRSKATENARDKKRLNTRTLYGVQVKKSEK